MQIKAGATRIVVLLGKNAIKIGRVRPLNLLFRAFAFPFSRAMRKRFAAKYGRSIFTAVRNDILAGLVANRKEYDYYVSHGDPRVMPVRRCLLGGWIIVQEGGAPITSEDFERENPFKIPDAAMYDLGEPKQFCRRPLDNKVVLVDFGREDTIQLLTATFGQ